FDASKSQVLLGLRHTGAGNGYLTGDIEEARLYDRAMTPREIAASFRAGIFRLPANELEQGLGETARSKRAELVDLLERERRVLAELPPQPLAYAANPQEPEPTYVLKRGDVEKKGERVSAGGLSAIKVPRPEFGLLL